MICGCVMLFGQKQPFQSWQQASRYNLMAGSSHMQAVPTPISAVVAHRSIHEALSCAGVGDVVAR
jgi:glucose uptake protein GlcU